MVSAFDEHRLDQLRVGVPRCDEVDSDARRGPTRPPTRASAVRAPPCSCRRSRPDPTDTRAATDPTRTTLACPDAARSGWHRRVSSNDRGDVGLVEQAVLGLVVGDGPLADVVPGAQDQHVDRGPVCRHAGHDGVAAGRGRDIGADLDHARDPASRSSAARDPGRAAIATQSRGRRQMPPARSRRPARSRANRRRRGRDSRRDARPANGSERAVTRDTARRTRRARWRDADCG